MCVCEWCVCGFVYQSLSHTVPLDIGWCMKRLIPTSCTEAKFHKIVSSEKKAYMRGEKVLGVHHPCWKLKKDEPGAKLPPKRMRTRFDGVDGVVKPLSEPFDASCTKLFYMVEDGVAQNEVLFTEAALGDKARDVFKIAKASVAPKTVTKRKVGKDGAPESVSIKIVQQKDQADKVGVHRIPNSV